MAAVATHILVGMLVAAVAGVRTRYLPLAGLFAEWIDLDHIFSGPGPSFPTASGADPIWMMNRATFHNVWVVALIPAAIAIYLCIRRIGSADVRRFAVAAPAILSSHTLFDMVNVQSGHPYNGSVPFYPFSFSKLGFDVSGLTGAPEYFDALSFALLVAVLLGLTARIVSSAVVEGELATFVQAVEEKPPDEEAVDLAEDEAAEIEDDGELEPTGEDRPADELSDGAIVRLIAYGLLFGLVLPLVTWIASEPTTFAP